MSKAHLYMLLNQVLQKSITIEDFCNEFHISFDHDLDISTLSQKELLLFRDLAHFAARYTEFDEDLEKYPNVYVSSDEILLKVSEIKLQLLF